MWIVTHLFYLAQSGQLRLSVFIIVFHLPDRHDLCRWRKNFIDGVSELWYSFSMNKDTCLIYEGSSFRIEWFFDESGYSQPYEYFLKASNAQKRKFLLLAKKMGDYGKIFDKTKFRNEGDDIYAFKPQPDRYLCFFFTGKKIIVTNAFRKKSEKIPRNEKDLAQKNKRIYHEMVKENKRK